MTGAALWSAVVWAVAHEAGCSLVALDEETLHVARLSNVAGTLIAPSPPVAVATLHAAPATRTPGCGWAHEPVVAMTMAQVVAPVHLAAASPEHDARHEGCLSIHGASSPPQS